MKLLQKTLEIMKEHDLKFKKKFGQNFLIDENILKNIVKSGLIDKDTGVIEIGPGIGFLTTYLKDAAKRVLAYEIDYDFIEILNREFKKTENLIVINKDILQCDVKADIAKYLNDCKEIIVVANIPYNITTPLIFNLLENVMEIKRYVLLMQKEVADRLCATQSNKEYNSLSVAIQYRTEVKKLFNVPKTVFIPKPNVDSAVIRLDLKEVKDRPKDELHFFSLVRNSFRHRRKTLVNNLCFAYNITKEKADEILEQLNFDKLIRSENLLVKDFIKLSDIFLENGIN